MELSKYDGDKDLSKNIQPCVPLPPTRSPSKQSALFKQTYTQTTVFVAQSLAGWEDLISSLHGFPNDNCSYEEEAGKKEPAYCLPSSKNRVMNMYYLRGATVHNMASTDFDRP